MSSASENEGEDGTGWSDEDPEGIVAEPASDPAAARAGELSFPGVFSAPPRDEAGAAVDPALLAGRYKLISEIGRGGLGVVFKALDTESGETVAIKFLQDDSPQDGSVLDRLIMEVSLVRKLKHPSICTVHCLQSHAGKPFVAMEILRGPTLNDYLAQQGGRLPLERVVELMRPVAEALDQVHGRNVVHRDLKPGNLQFDRAPENGGRLKILDFGLASSAVRGDGTEQQRHAGGSPAYRAPEQARGAPPKPAADLYSFAVTLYELLAGTPPFMGKDLDRKVQSQRPPPVPGLGRATNRVLLEALSKSPTGRPRSAALLVDRLEASTRWSWFTPFMVLLALAGLALVIALR